MEILWLADQRHSHQTRHFSGERPNIGSPAGVDGEGLFKSVSERNDGRRAGPSPVRWSALLRNFRVLGRCGVIALMQLLSPGVRAGHTAE
jgi:hypothetical protein